MELSLNDEDQYIEDKKTGKKYKAKNTFTSIQRL